MPHPFKAEAMRIMVAVAMTQPGAGVWLQPMVSRATLNLALLAAGLALEGALVWAVFRRRVARRFPGFAALMIFYPLRAATLFALARSLDADTYNSVFTLLEAVEIPLLAWVCAELAARLARGRGGSNLRRSLEALALIAIAVSLAWTFLRWIPERQLADRAQITVGFLMLELFWVAWKAARAGKVAPNVARIPAGFASFAVLQLAALAGKAHAMAWHASGEYVAWSYVPACGFLAVVVFWLGALKRED